MSELEQAINSYRLRCLEFAKLSKAGSVVLKNIVAKELKDLRKKINRLRLEEGECTN